MSRADDIGSWVVLAVLIAVVSFAFIWSGETPPETHYELDGGAP